MIEIDTTQRQKERCSWISLSMILVPVLFIVLAFALSVMRHWGLSTPIWVVTFLRQIGLPQIWLISGLIGLVCGIRASQLARWSGNELFFIVIHLLSLFLITCLFVGF